MELNREIEKDILKKAKQREEALSKFACPHRDAKRLKEVEYGAIRENFTRDVEAICNFRQFNRYSNKTQVFSLRKNNDVSNRSYHVQLVSRIARTIANCLDLNVALIEAIALAHDLGHPPFGHQGELFIDNISSKHGYRFFHHVQSARYLFEIMKESNISLQVIDGALCHNGEVLSKIYSPNENATKSFEELNVKLEKCYTKKILQEELMPATLEGCLVRLVDVVAYLGKDRQDAEKIGIFDFEENYPETVIGKYNHEFIKNITIDIINNSYGKKEIVLSEEVFDAIKKMKDFNYKNIYGSKAVSLNKDNMQKMFEEVFEFLYNDFTINKAVVLKKLYYPNIGLPCDVERYVENNKNSPERVVTDFIASMCDDYFIEFYNNFKAQNNWSRSVEIQNYEF